MMKIVTAVLVLSASINAAAQSNTWDIQDIGTFPGHTFSRAFSINEAGDIVGHSNDGGSDQGFLYRNGIMYAIGTLGGIASSARAINSVGVSSGGSQLPGNTGAHAFAFSLTTGMRDLGTIDTVPNYSFAYGINDAGKVVGRANDHAFVWDPATATMSDVGSFGGTSFSIAWAINNLGHIVGESPTPYNFIRGFLFDGTSFLDIGPTNGGAVAQSINNLDQVVGHATFPEGTRAFLYTNGVIVSLGALGGPVSRAYDINDSGEVVGNYIGPDGNERAFYYAESSGMQDLHTLVGGTTSGWTRLRYADSINNKGQIVGQGFINGQQHAFLITPPPKLVYNFDGFFPPIENAPTVNVVKAGSAIPVKFSLNGDQGMGILASGYPKALAVSCDNYAALNEVIETVTAGNSAFTYDATTDIYLYTWKTQKTWAGTCQKLVVRLKDNNDHYAFFQFR